MKHSACSPPLVLPPLCAPISSAALSLNTPSSFLCHCALHLSLMLHCHCAPHPSCCAVTACFICVLLHFICLLCCAVPVRPISCVSLSLCATVRFTCLLRCAVTVCPISCCTTIVCLISCISLRALFVSHAALLSCTICCDAS